MAERINRKDDKKKYQPPLHKDRIHELYEIKEKTGIPMTVHADRAIRDYVENYETLEVEWFEDQLYEEHVEEIETLNAIDLAKYAKGDN